MFPMARRAGVRTDISLEPNNPTRIGTTPVKNTPVTAMTVHYHKATNNQDKHIKHASHCSLKVLPAAGSVFDIKNSLPSLQCLQSPCLPLMWYLTSSIWSSWFNKKHSKNVVSIRHCEPPHAPFTRCRIDVHDNDDANNDDDNNDNAWQRGPLWPHRMGSIILKPKLQNCHTSFTSLMLMTAKTSSQKPWFCNLRCCKWSGFLKNIHYIFVSYKLVKIPRLTSIV